MSWEGHSGIETCVRRDALKGGEVANQVLPDVLERLESEESGKSRAFEQSGPQVADEIRRIVRSRFRPSVTRPFEFLPRRRPVVSASQCVRRPAGNIVLVVAVWRQCIQERVVAFFFGVVL